MTVYLVQKLHWEYNDNWFEREGDEPVKAFESHEDAQLWAELLEDEARRELEKGEGVGFSVNPLRVFGRDSPPHSATGSGACWMACVSMKSSRQSWRKRQYETTRARALIGAEVWRYS